MKGVFRRPWCKVAAGWGGVLALVLLVSATGCRNAAQNQPVTGLRPIAPPRGEWEKFRQSRLKKHAPRLGVERAVPLHQRVGSPHWVDPTAINQQDPKYWRLWLGKKKVDPVWFQQRVRAFGRMTPMNMGFDEARQNVAGQLAFEAVCQDFLKKHPDLLGEAQLAAEVSRVKKSYSPQAIRALLTGVLPPEDKKIADLRQGVQINPVAPRGMGSPNMTSLMQPPAPAPRQPPAPPPRPDDGALRVAVDKLDKKTLSRLKHAEIKNGMVIVRPKVFDNEAAFDRYLRETTAARLIAQRAQERYGEPATGAGGAAKK